MREFTGEIRVAGAASGEVLGAVLRSDERYALYVGLDVHKDSIAVALAWPGRGEARYRGEIANETKAVKKLVEQLSALTGGGLMVFCYEAGPCGYGLYRQLLSVGQACEVVVPPKRGRIKTDRRDALKLARLLRAGELTSVWVPDEEQEAMRDFSRCRGDFKGQEQKARQQLNAFVLRHGHHWARGKTRWTQAHYRWLEQLEFAHPWQHEVMRAYLEAVRTASERVKAVERRLLNDALPQWRLAPVVDSLVALRGVDKVAAVVILAELGDLRRFDSPTQLMGYLGLVPGEASSGRRRRQGAITRAGNTHARRMLVESAWSYRFPARQTAHLKRKAQHASGEAKAIAWHAQKRLCGRYRTLMEAGKNHKVVCVAIARELAGFIWDLVCQAMAKLRTV
jgi:transposase